MSTEISTSSVIRKMGKIDNSPMELNELIVAWNKLCEEHRLENKDDFQFAEIENAAIAALSDISNTNPSGLIGKEISRMLSAFEHPAFLVTVSGQIAATNTVASCEFDLGIGDKIDQLPYSLDTAQTISALVGEHLKQNESGLGEALLRRAHGKGDERSATVAITASIGRDPVALVFVITTKWKQMSADILQQQFGLTNVETKVLVNFVDGYSSQDIAKLRKRSHGTVRTQFQSILSKVGVRNQTELLRVVLSISDFNRDIGAIADAVKHPYRRRAEILREGGRRVEVTLMGDYNGDPIFTVANACNYTFSAQVEQQLFDAGLYLISMCAPDCGSTDSVPEGVSRLMCIAEDARAIMDQLGIESCPIMAHNTNSPVCYSIASQIPERVSHIVQIAACVPHRFLKEHMTQSTWINAVLKAGVGHPSMRRMLFKSTVKVWTTIGTRQYMRLQLTSNPHDAKLAFLPENMAEFEYALKTATQSGIAAATGDIELIILPWAIDVETLPMNITLIHGSLDTLFTIESARKFASAYPHKIEMIELNNAGFTVLQSRTAEVTRILRSLVDRYSSDAIQRQIDGCSPKPVRLLA